MGRGVVAVVVVAIGSVITIITRQAPNRLVTCLVCNRVGVGHIGAICYYRFDESADATHANVLGGFAEIDVGFLQYGLLCCKNFVSLDQNQPPDFDLVSFDWLDRFSVKSFSPLVELYTKDHKISYSNLCIIDNDQSLLFFFSFLLDKMTKVIFF